MTVISDSAPNSPADSTVWSSSTNNPSTRTFTCRIWRSIRSSQCFFSCSIAFNSFMVVNGMTSTVRTPPSKVFTFSSRGMTAMAAQKTFKKKSSKVHVSNGNKTLAWNTACFRFRNPYFITQMKQSLNITGYSIKMPYRHSNIIRDLSTSKFHPPFNNATEMTWGCNKQLHIYIYNKFHLGHLVTAWFNCFCVQAEIWGQSLR